MVSKKILSIFISVICLGVMSCGGGSSSSDDDNNNNDNTSTLTDVFPSDLVLVSPTAERSSAWTAANVSALTREEVVPFDDQATLQEILEGTVVSDCQFTFDLTPTYANANCFGPQITYTNHPDGAPTDGVIGGGDLGIMFPTVFNSSEACAAGQMNERIGAVAGQVNSVVYAMASLKCFAGVGGSIKPAAGETLDLTSVVSSGVTSNSIAFTVTSASLARATADTADGFPVYILTLSGTTTTTTDDGDVDNIINVRLKHIPTATDNSTYRGKLSYTIGWPEIQDDWQGNCDEFGATDATDAVSISYEKTAATALSLDFRGASFCGTTSATLPYVDEAGGNYTVDLTNYATDENLTGYGGSANYALYSFDPATGAGDFIFGWQAGMTDNARILEASVDETGGVVSGCGYYGYGQTFSEYDFSDTLPAINGMFCAWSGPGATHTSRPYAERQCFTYNAGTSLFEVDEDVGASAITYAPTDLCETAVGGNFAYHDASGNIDYDQITDGDITKETAGFLIDFQAVDVGAITPPTEVDE